MASLSKDKNGNRTIQFVGGDRKRRSIRLTKLLGKVSAKVANEIKTKVEALNAAAISYQSWDRETADWVGKIGGKLHDKLADLGLVPRRAKATRDTLGAFLAGYIKGRGDVKGSTASVYTQTERCLVEYFGAAKPLADVTAGDADEWRRWLATEDKDADGKVTRKKLGDNTIRRRCGVARQFFRAAQRKRLIADNPFGEMKGVTVRSNRSRDYFVTRAEAASVLEACPDTQWMLLFALSRYGGLRCPSEHLALRWGDVDLTAGRMVVRSPKTEHIDDKAMRVVPIFPELKPYLDDAWELFEAGSQDLDAKAKAAAFVITRYRDSNSNLRTQLERIITKAGLAPWPKLFQNLRASRATELAAEFPSHVAAEWLGHSTLVAQKHYWRTTDDDFDKATSTPTGALQKAVQSAAVSPCNDSQGDDEELAIAGNFGDYDTFEHARQDSNLRPTD